MPLMSVPRHLKVSPQNPVINTPYIKSTAELNTKWKDKLSGMQRPIIGINWRGNRQDPGKKNRDIPAKVFNKVLKHNKEGVLCLQRGAHNSEVTQIRSLNQTEIPQHDVLEICNSDNPECFLEYAAIISNCDLVITGGTTISHLSAGLGIPTWVLLPKIPDWRWGLQGETSFWYPSMRLFRQNKKGDWNEVVEQVAMALQQEFGL